MGGASALSAWRAGQGAIGSRVPPAGRPGLLGLRRLQSPLALWVFSAVYVLATGLAQSLTDAFTTPAGVSVWFPPAALVVAALYATPVAVGLPLVIGTRVLWAVILASSAPAWLSITNAVLVGLAYALVVGLSRRFTRAPRERARPGQQVAVVAGFLAFVASLGPLLAALSTRVVVAASGRMDWASLPEVVVDFWVGDAVAIITLVPLFGAVATIVEERWPVRALAELAAGVAVSVGLGWFVIGTEIGGGTTLYLALVPVVALSMRHALVGAAVANAAAALGATAALAVRTDVVLGVVAAHTFLIVMAVVGLTVGVGEFVRRRAATELAISEQRYRQMVQVIEDYAICRLDREGRIATWNDGARRLKGYDAEEIIGQHFRLLHVPDDRRAGLAERLLEQARIEGTAEHEGWRARRDGSHFWAQVTITRLTDDSAQVIGYTKVTRDLTQRRNAERELAERTRQLERSNEELERFASVASHDLQEPLRMIASYAQMLERRYADQIDAEGREMIAYVVDGVHRMRELIVDLLDYSRLHTRPPADSIVDLSLLIDEVLRDLRVPIEETGARIEVDELPTLRGDHTRLRTLVQNLIGNALKYRSEEPPVIAVHAEPASSGDGTWTFSVVDNGIGIAPEDRENVFEPFRRLHPRSEYGGTGIGLAICRRVVEDRGGRIWVEPNEPRGSAFRFTLPAD